MHRLQKHAILGAACVEMFFFSGVFYGFNSLIPIYKDAKVFSQFCGSSIYNVSVSCSTQDLYFGRAFVTWLFVQAIMSFVLGFILDKFGIKFMKVIAATCLIGGFICFGFTTQVNWLLFPAGSLLTMSAHSLGISNISLASVSSRNCNFFVALFSALFDASAVMMSCIKYIRDIGVPFWIICTSYGLVGALVILLSICWLKPFVKDMMPQKKEENLSSTLEDNNLTNENDVNVKFVHSDSMKVQYEKYVQEKYPNLMKCFSSPEYVFQASYFAIVCFRFTFFMAQLSSQLKYVFEDHTNIVDNLLSSSNIFFLGSIIISPMFGFLLDKYQSYTFEYLSRDPDVTPKHIYRQINACFSVPSTICSVAMILGSSLISVPNQFVFYLVFTCITITRSLLFSINGAYLFLVFPIKYFGTLIGSIFLVSGLMNLLQQAIIQFAQADSHPDLINYILLGLCSISCFHGLFLKIRSFRDCF